MTTPIPKLATSELVTLAWLRGAVTAYDVAAGTTLQGPDPNTGILTWGDTGFVTTTVVGGAPHSHLPLRQPVMSVDCWATHVDTTGVPRAPSRKQPPWGRANMIAELLVAAAYDAGGDDGQRPVTLPTGFPVARVVGAVVLGEPQRVRGDDANYAHFTFNLAISWLSL
jgi:hypothetical protein